MRIPQQKRNTLQTRPLQRLDLVVEMIVQPVGIPLVEIEGDVLHGSGIGGQRGKFRAAFGEGPVGEIEGVEGGVEVNARWGRGIPEAEGVVFLGEGARLATCVQQGGGKRVGGYVDG